MKRLRLKKRFGILLIILFTFTFLFSLFKILNWNMENNQNKKIVKEIKDDIVTIDKNTKEEVIDPEKLKEVSKNAFGYIKIPNTNVDYPTVQYSDNNYYLNHNIYDEANSAGWIFADYRNKLDGTDKNIILYGHARLDGTMFGSLEKTVNSAWYNNEHNLDIKFFIGNNNYVYRIFSIYKIKPEDYYITTEFSDSEYYNFLTTIEKRSINNFNAKLDINSKILTLSTCASNNTERLVIHAVLIN